MTLWKLLRIFLLLRAMSAGQQLNGNTRFLLKGSAESRTATCQLGHIVPN